MKSLDEIMERGNRVDYHLPRWSHAREIDDALDAAGAPHCDEHGTLSTVQRIQALAKLAHRPTAARDPHQSPGNGAPHERAGALLSASLATSADQTEQRPPLGARPRWLHDSMRMVDLAEAIVRNIRSSYTFVGLVDKWAAELADISRSGHWRGTATGGVVNIASSRPPMV